MAAPTMAEIAAIPATLPPTEGTFTTLSRHRADRPSVVTCYVRLEVPDRIAGRYRLAVREALRPFHDLPGSHPEREALGHDLERITAWLSDQRRLPHSPGLVLVASESLDLFSAVPLPRVTRTRALLDVRPRLAEAAVAAPEFAPVLLAALDRTHARFFRISLDDVEELPGLTLPARRGGKFHSDRGDAPGWGEHDYHARIREERHRHAAAVADRLAELLAREPWLGIVVGGPARVTTEQVRFLPHAVQQHLLQEVRLNPTALPEKDIRRIGLAARDIAHRRRMQTCLAEFETALGTGWAVTGARPTLRALALGQVRVLLVRAGLSGRGVRCALSGRLAMSAADCRGEGEPMPVADIVNEAIEDAMRQRVEVVMVDDPGARTLDGLGAVLRFRSRAAR